LPAALRSQKLTVFPVKKRWLRTLPVVEVETKIAEAIAPRHYVDGFHSTGTCGSFGSVAASAKLRRLNLEQTLCALELLARKLRIARKFRHDDKTIQAGHAAENGVAAADLAGLVGPRHPKFLTRREGSSTPTADRSTLRLYRANWAIRGAFPNPEFL